LTTRKRLHFHVTIPDFVSGRGFFWKSKGRNLDSGSVLLKATLFKSISVAALTSIAASTGIAQTTAREYCNRGVARQRKGDLNGALADYSRAIQLNPEDGTAYNDRGLVKMAKGDLDGALADCDRALQINPRNIKFHNNRGLVRQRKGDLDGALADYDIAIKFYRKYADAYRNRATVKMAEHDLDGALADYNRAIALGLKDAAVFYNRALAESAKGDLDAATKDFHRAAKVDPKFARKEPPPAATQAKITPTVAPHENRPIEFQSQNGETGGNLDRSAQNKEQPNDAHRQQSPAAPTETGKKRTAAVSNRDTAKSPKNDHTPAAVENNPTPTPPVRPVGGADTGDVRNKTASSSLSTESNPIVELHPKNIATANSGSLAEGFNASRPVPPTKPEISDDVNVGKQKEDLNSAALDRAVQPPIPNIPPGADLGKPTNPDVNIAPGSALEPTTLKPGGENNITTHQNDMSGPSANDRRPTEREPTTPLGYDRRAQFRKTMGDLNGALADYSRAIELNSKDATAYNGRGNIRRAKRDLDGALSDYNRAIELNGANAIAYYNRGITKQSKGDLDGALADFNPAIQLDPKMAAAYHSRGGAKAMKGDLDGAMADYDHAIELDPKDPATYANRAGLFFLKRNWGAALKDYDRFFGLSKEGQEYPRLYAWLIRARTGERDAANKALIDYLQQRGNTADWFSKVADCLLDRITDDELLAGAESADKRKESGQLCEAWFYIGMKKLIRNDRSGAQACFKRSVDTGRKDYTEYYFARAELKALRK
jgi:tetratricopeptide (TPR) repeat protein